MGEPSLGAKRMKWRHARGQFVAAFVAILLNTFAPTLHAIVHANSLVPGFSAGLAAKNAPGKSQDTPSKPSNEEGCALGQALPGVGPVLAQSNAAALFLAAIIATVEALPAQSLDGILPPRPASRGPPAFEA